MAAGTLGQQKGLKELQGFGCHWESLATLTLLTLAL